jgi:hypothetical protein
VPLPPLPLPPAAVESCNRRHVACGAVMTQARASHIADSLIASHCPNNFIK